MRRLAAQIHVTFSTNKFFLSIASQSLSLFLICNFFLLDSPVLFINIRWSVNKFSVVQTAPEKITNERCFVAPSKLVRQRKKVGMSDVNQVGEKYSVNYPIILIIKATTMEMCFSWPRAVKNCGNESEGQVKMVVTFNSSEFWVLLGPIAAPGGRKA